eukprot:PhF_6_TR11703/c0_g1_i1/m.19029
MDKHRLEQALSKIVNRTRQDSVLMRFWDVIMLFSIATSYVRCTLTVMVSDTWLSEIIDFAVVGLALSPLYLTDVYLRARFIHQRDRSKYSPAYHVLNLCTALPWDGLLVSTSGLSRGTVMGIVAIQAARIFFVPFLFYSDSPDVVDVNYIRFFYVLLPKLQLVTYTVLSIHTLIILHIVAIHGTESDYGSSVMWVWTIITSAPFNVDMKSDGETALAGCLMLLAMLVQGYFVSAVSTILLGFSMQDQNKSHLLITLEMLRYYKVPFHLQEEVLSFQYHVLQDSSVQTQYAPELERLPPTMLREIEMCVKVGVLDKVSFLDLAPKDCKRNLAYVMKQLMIDPITSIIRSGDIGKSMYFMLHGLADVTLPNGLIVATIRRGDFFGEIALINSDAKRTATVCALTYCDVLELTKVDFDETIKKFPEFLEIVESKRSKQPAQNATAATGKSNENDEAEGTQLGDIDLTQVAVTAPIGIGLARRGTLLSSGSSGSHGSPMESENDGALVVGRHMSIFRAPLSPAVVGGGSGGGAHRNSHFSRVSQSSKYPGTPLLGRRTTTASGAYFTLQPTFLESSSPGINHHTFGSLLHSQAPDVCTLAVQTERSASSYSHRINNSKRSQSTCSSTGSGGGSLQKGVPINNSSNTAFLNEGASIRIFLKDENTSAGVAPTLTKVPKANAGECVKEIMDTIKADICKEVVMLNQRQLDGLKPLKVQQYTNFDD